MNLSEGIERYSLARNKKLTDRHRTVRYTRLFFTMAIWGKEDRRSPVRNALTRHASDMGMADLVSSERYLRMTPERFRGPLTLLSPKKRRVHWRDDPAVMTFLAKL
jgi:integrase/recombinase XerD